MRGVPKFRLVVRSLVVVLLTVMAGLLFQADSAGIAEDHSSNNKANQAVPEDWFRPDATPWELMRELKEDQISDRWFYHDLDTARDQARKSGKPLLVLFRCVPCGSAPGLDGAVCTAGGAEASKFEAEIRAAGGELDALLDQFVAVRIVKMNGVNRNVFRFDRDVPYVAMYVNADGTVYGRYGTRMNNDRKNLPRHNLSSFQQSLRRALDLHRDYPRNKTELAGKRDPIKTPSMASDMPEFKPFPEKYNPVVKNCIHCHTLGEAELRETLAENALQLRDIWPYPRPVNVGLEVDVKDGLLIERVVADSPAAQAGIQRGDVLTRLSNQSLTSEADVQWVLHHAPDQGTVPFTVRRGERLVEGKLALRDDWRKNPVRWRATMNVLRPDVIFDPHPEGLRAYYPSGKAAQVGIKGGDLIIAVDGKAMYREADFLKYIHIDRPNAKSVELTIVRNETRFTVTLPIR